MGDLTENSIAANTDIEEKLDKIKDMRTDYLNLVNDFLEDYASELVQDPVMKGAWKDAFVNNTVRQHAITVTNKKESLFPRPQLSELERQTMEVHKSTMEFHQISLDQMQKTSTAQGIDKAEQDRIMAETEGNTFLGECSVLGDLMEDEDWEDVDDEAVSSAMRNLSKWQDQMTIIENPYF